MEASTLQSPAALSPARIRIGPRLLRLRTDEQLVALFRAGHDEAFRVLYDRYHKRLEAYARQMLPGAHDAEDALQDVFVRAYRALQTGDRELAVKAWLFRIVHNRCIDELRRATPPVSDLAADTPCSQSDPAIQAHNRESLRRLIADIQRLPEQQRAALLMRELSGSSYTELAEMLDTTVPAVKSLLVRARMGLVRASEARDTDCSEIREQLVVAHDQGVRADASVRRHLRDCPGCRSYRHEVFLVRRRLAAVLPMGPFAALAKLVGVPGGGATTATGGGAAPAAAVGSGGAASGVALGANHVAVLLAAAIASAGGAAGLQHVISSMSRTPARTVPAHRSHAKTARLAAGREHVAVSSSAYVRPRLIESDTYRAPAYFGADGGATRNASRANSSITSDASSGTAGSVVGGSTNAGQGVAGSTGSLPSGQPGVAPGSTNGSSGSVAGGTPGGSGVSVSTGDGSGSVSTTGSGVGVSSGSGSTPSGSTSGTAGSTSGTAGDAGGGTSAGTTTGTDGQGTSTGTPTGDGPSATAAGASGSGSSSSSSGSTPGATS